MLGKLNPHIVAASVFGLLLVGGAFWMSPYRENSRLDPRQEVVAGPAPERSYVAVTDEDADGIADWKETIPNTPEWLITQQSIASDSGTTTKTHTETVALDMLERVMRSNMYGGFGDSNEGVVDRSNAYIESLAIDPLFTERDITVYPDDSTDTLRRYGNHVAEITFANAVSVEIEDEVMILERAMQTQDPAALADLSLIAASYEGIVEDLLTASVPESLAREHLDLINTVNAIAIDIRGFEAVFADPLLALVRVRRYGDDVLGLYQAVSNLYLAIDDAGVKWTESDAASRFIRVE